MSPSRCVRWTPTSEQLMVLEELYRRGLRNPKASQIDSITSYLAAFGKIQNKNVLYWFQNHKARERQRIRNKLYQQHQMELQLQSSNTSSGMQFLSHCLAAQNQVATTGLEKHVLWGDPPADSPARTDVIMILDVGYTTACRPSSPPETLELFPLRPPNIDEDHQVTAE